MIDRNILVQLTGCTNVNGSKMESEGITKLELRGRKLENINELEILNRLISGKELIYQTELMSAIDRGQIDFLKT